MKDIKGYLGILRDIKGHYLIGELSGVNGSYRELTDDTFACRRWANKQLLIVNY